MYALKHFPPKAKESTLEMIRYYSIDNLHFGSINWFFLSRYIKAEFKKIVDNIDWMDEATKQRAYEKLENMRENIAYPDEILDKG